MGRFYNRGMPVNILTAVDRRNSIRTAVFMRQSVNTPLECDNNMGETVFSMWFAPSKRTKQ